MERPHFARVDERSEELLDELLGMCAIYGVNSRRVIDFVHRNKWREGWWRAAHDRVSYWFRPESPQWGVEPNQDVGGLAILGIILGVFAMFLILILIMAATSGR